MVYYDPIHWVDFDDSLVESVEIIVKAEKLADSKSRQSSKAFLPKNELELNVKIIGFIDILRLTEWVDQLGRCHLRLSDTDTIYRRGDFKEKNYHTNPNKVVIPPPHHIHFPTIRYSLLGHHSYAYPVITTKDESGNDYISSLRLFCLHNNIVLNKVSLPLLNK